MSAEQSVISERMYKGGPHGQGYAVTQLHRLPVRGNPLVRVVVTAGNDRNSTRADVDRWDGSQWQRVVHLNGYELDAAPSYVCWDHDRKVNGRPACEDWLTESAELALDYARQVTG